MDIGFQAVREDGKIGGALSEYQTTVVAYKYIYQIILLMQRVAVLKLPIIIGGWR